MTRKNFEDAIEDIRCFVDCKPFKSPAGSKNEEHEDMEARIDRLIDRRVDDIVDICRIPNRNVPAAGVSDGSVRKSVAGVQWSAPGGRYLDKPLHQDSELEESYQKLFVD